MTWRPILVTIGTFIAACEDPAPLREHRTCPALPSLMDADEIAVVEIVFRDGEPALQSLTASVAAAGGNIEIILNEGINRFSHSCIEDTITANTDSPFSRDINDRVVGILVISEKTTFNSMSGESMAAALLT